MLKGCATKEGTTRFIERFPVELEASSYRRFRRLRLSSLGAGTYLGEATEEDEAKYRESLAVAIAHGCNVIDTAINYRHMSSERAVGATLRELVEKRTVSRDEIFVSTKGGYLPYDASSAMEAPAYWRKELVEKQVLSEAELEHSLHSLKPEFIDWSIEKSRSNLGLETIDLYYLHNPEEALHYMSRERFYPVLQAAFEVLEKAVREKRIGAYGLATWDGFRIEEGAERYISLKSVLETAVKAGGAEHNFAAIQLPLNLSRFEALKLRNQVLSAKGERMCAAKAIAESRLGLFASTPLDQGRLTKYLPVVMKTYFPGLGSDTLVALQFARSCSGVVSALVGMRTKKHTLENLALLKHSPVAPENFVPLFSFDENVPV